MKNWSFAVLVVLLVAPNVAQAQNLKEKFQATFIDSLDNKLDVSSFLTQVYGFVPLVSPITEPAVGLGAAGGLVFVHRTREDVLVKPGVPSSLSVVGGLATANGSWGIGAFHQGIWKDDRIRFRGGLGYFSMNLTLYPSLAADTISIDPTVAARGLDFKIKGVALGPDIAFRIKNSPVFFGAQYTFFKNKVSFERPGLIPGVEPWEMDSQVSGLGPFLLFDNLDNPFTPNRGMRSQVTYRYFDPFLGSSRAFHLLDAFWTGYYDLHQKVILGLRLDGRFSFEGTPFYMRPYISLRGIPVMRYQGQHVLVAETEGRWNVSQRWGLVGFGGVGATTFTIRDRTSRKSAYNAGLGVRYLVARLFGLYMGLDVARGPEDWAFYLQFGSAWSSL